MSQFDYEAIRDGVVEPALVEFGQDATLTQPGASTGPEYDPTPGTPVDYDVKVLKTVFTVADKTGGLVQEDDLKFMLSTEGDPLPDLKGTLTVGGVLYQVTKLEPKGPAATILFWYVWCRK